MRTALVLSAGGMFGAYQAGAWKALSQVFQPDVVIGASIGAVNGWAIAGRCLPDRLIENWLSLEGLSAYRWRVPVNLRHGLIDSRPVENLVQKIHSQFQPSIDFAMVATDTVRLRPVLFRGPEVTWKHLAASAAIMGLFKQHRIGGRTYSDGGLLCTLPLWAVEDMDVQRVIGINVLPKMPSIAVKTAAAALRKVSRFRARAPKSVEVIQLSTPGALGSARDALYWKRQNAERWIKQGESDTWDAIHAGRIPVEVRS